MPQPPVVLTIAGSDSGGAAGLQADLKTFAALGVYGTSAITVVTAQNSVRVDRAHFLPPDFVAAQIDAVLFDYGAVAIKTGFIGRVELIEVVAGRLRHWQDILQPFILVDPVLVNHRAEPMFPPDVTVAYRDLLCPVADLVTPNRHEAVLLGANAARPIESAGALGARRVLLKGLPEGDSLVDALWADGAVTRFPHEQIATANLHGSGDTLSAAICAEVALGRSLHEAIGRAQAFTLAAIRRGADWRMGSGHGPLGHGPRPD